MTSTLSVRDGSEVQCGDRRFVIRQVLAFDTVVAEDAETGALERLGIADLRPLTAETRGSSTADLAELHGRDWEEARRRRELIAPLIDGSRCSHSIVAERARAGDCGVTTLYRWARLYRASGLLSSLLPERPNGGRGKSRLSAVVEKIVTQTIEEHYL